MGPLLWLPPNKGVSLSVHFEIHPNSEKIRTHPYQSKKARKLMY